MPGAARSADLLRSTLADLGANERSGGRRLASLRLLLVRASFGGPFEKRFTLDPLTCIQR